MKLIASLFFCFALYVPLQAKSGFPCSSWPSLTSNQKEEVITQVIQLAQRDGVCIRRPASYYVRELDGLIGVYQSEGNEQALAESLGATFKTIAVTDGDWDDGRDPLVIAQTTLGVEQLAIFEKEDPDRYKALLAKSEAWRKRANQALLPTTTAVTPAAAHPSRQP